MNMDHRRSRGRARRFFGATFLLLVLLISAPFLLRSGGHSEGTSSPSPGLPQLRVLVLSENRLLSPWYEATLDTFRNAMRDDHGRTVTLQWDPINMTRYADPSERQLVVDEFAANHPGLSPDLVLTLDSAAVFALEQKEQFFRDTPVVAITLEESVLGGRSLPPDFTAVMQDFVPLRTVETALELFPDLRRLVIVNGRSPIERAHSLSARKSLEPLAKRLDLEWLDHHTYEETRERLSRLPEDSAVLFVRFFTDGTGRWFTPREVVGELSRSTDAPVFVLWGTLLGTGAIGGVLMDPTVEGNLTAELADLLLNRRPAPPRMLPAVPIFDWRVMQRFGLKAGDLPAGSLVRHKPPTMWESYRTELLLAAGVFSLLVLTIVVLVLSILHRRKAAKRLAERTDALRESRAKLDAALASMTDAVSISDAAGRFIHFNDAFATFHRFRSREECAETFSEYPDILEVFLADGSSTPMEMWAVARALRGEKGTNAEYLLRRKDTGESWVGSYSFAPIRDPQGAVVGSVVVGRDVTDHKQAEKSLRESEEKFRALFEQAAVGMGRVGFAEARWIDVNEAFCRMLGYSREEVCTIPWPQMTHPEDLELDLIPFRRMAAGELDSYTVEKRFLHRDGHPVWARLTLSLVRDARGEPDYEIAVIEDITERKRAEDQLRRLTRDLERRVEERTAELTAANRELEAFTYMVSHDLRAPLRHITEFIGILRARYQSGLDGRGKEYLDIVAEAAKRMGVMIEDLLTFSRLGRSPLQKVPVDLRTLIGEVLRELAPESAGRGIEWKIGPLPPVQADPVLLRPVITNLLANALKFTRGRDPAVVEIGCEEQEKEMIYYVRDNGVGFDMRKADRLFGVFQRLHPENEFEGTGIGLASVQRIIERHGGRVWAEGEVGRGATFFFSLPREGR